MAMEAERVMRIKEDQENDPIWKVWDDELDATTIFPVPPSNYSHASSHFK